MTKIVTMVKHTTDQNKLNKKQPKQNLFKTIEPKLQLNNCACIDADTYIFSINQNFYLQMYI